MGDPAQEAGGVMVTLSVAAAASGIDLELASLAEADRIETPEVVAKVRRRQAEKREALVGR
jgi:hypothetical protein